MRGFWAHDIFLTYLWHDGTRLEEREKEIE